jgi:acetolactate synthase-1/2/3 large subunit
MPQEVVEEVNDQTMDTKFNTIIATGVGQHQMCAARHYRWRRPRSMVTSGSLRTMGFGLPVAIGAKVARLECTVIDIDGDSSFCMTMMEIATAVQFNIEVKILVVNNEEQGMITQLQHAYYNSRVVHATQKNPNFVDLVKRMGDRGRRCSVREDLAIGVRWLLQTKGVVLLEMTDGNVPMIPIVPNGKPFDSILDSIKQKEDGLEN